MRIFFIVLLSFLQQHINCITFDEEVTKRLDNLLAELGTCSDYFQYKKIDGYINAKLTLPNLKLGDLITVVLTLNALAPLEQYQLLPDESSLVVNNRLQNRESITFRFDFAPSQFYTALLGISINNNELCKTTYAGAPSKEKTTIQHTFDLVNGAIPVFKFNPFLPNFFENAKTDTQNCGLVDENIRRQSSNATKLAYGGTEVRRGEHPWLVAIFRKRQAGTSFVCGGSLLNSRMILSAAHCFKGFVNLNADQILVYLGRNNLKSYREDGFLIREIEDLILHPNYRSDLIISDADLALLKMDESVGFTQFIRPICLWGLSTDELLIVNQTGVIAGWGDDGDGNRVTNAAKKVDLRIVSEIECVRSSDALNHLTSPRTLCAGNRDNSGPCHGDSGGALMLYRDNRWTLRGVISVGLTLEDRCDLLEYTVFCDVAKHKSWLGQYIEIQEQQLEGTAQDVCGIAGTEPHSKHPWLAAIYRRVVHGEIFITNGILISSRIVLANTERSIFPFLTDDRFRIYLGRYDLAVKSSGIVLRHIKSKESPLYFGTVTIMQLETSVTFTQYVKPICLWNEIPETSDTITQATIIGWVREKIVNGSLTVPLSRDVDILSRHYCKPETLVKKARIYCIPELGGDITYSFLISKRNGRWILRAVHDNYEFGFRVDLIELLPLIPSNV